VCVFGFSPFYGSVPVEKETSNSRRSFSWLFFCFPFIFYRNQLSVTSLLIFVVTITFVNSETAIRRKNHLHSKKKERGHAKRTPTHAMRSDRNPKNKSGTRKPGEKKEQQQRREVRETGGGVKRRKWEGQSAWVQYDDEKNKGSELYFCARDAAGIDSRECENESIGRRQPKNNIPV
jgi:hypothetical protein